MRVERLSARGAAFCIDRYEASLVEVAADGREHDLSPFEQVGSRAVRAVSREGVYPQGYLSRDEAEAACKRSSKRLCKESEWTTACRGASDTTFPYGANARPGACNDKGKAPLVKLGPVLTGDQWERMNDPRLNQVPGSLAKTGAHPECRSSFGVFDMVGNLHEWIDDREGSFMGGYYLDTVQNGPGCRYKTVVHGPTYHDYSTGFRCCTEVRSPPP